MGKASKQNVGVRPGASAAGKEIADMLWAALNASAKKKKSQGQSITPAGKSQGGGTTKLILPGVPASGSANHGSRAVDMILGTAPKSAGNTTAGQAGATSSKPASSTGSTAAGSAGSPSSTTSQNKNAFTDFLLHPDKYNPSKNGDKSSLSDADQLMSSADQNKIIYYQNAYANATSDIDKQFYHNLANQIRKKYGYTSNGGIANQKEREAKTNQAQDDRDAPAAGQATATGQDSGVVFGTRGNRATSDGMGVASSSAQAIDELRDMAAGRKEGDKISVAFQQDGKTVVYDTTVNAYGKLGLVFMRNATSKETTALAGTLNGGAGEQTGILGSPGANLGANHGSTGSADNGLAALLTAKGSDGTVEAFPSPADSVRGIGPVAGNITGSNRASGDDILTGLQMALDVAGLVPVAGEVADGLNALISLARGNYVDAGLSAAAMIPFLGWGATVAKGGKYLVKAVDAADTTLKYGDEVVDVGKGIVDEGTESSFKIGSFDELPSNAKNTYGSYDKNGWKGNFNGQTPGTKAGKVYHNTNDYLPKTDSAGNSITYREFDINAPVTGIGRDAERFVIGSDGSVYYTDSHYGQSTSPAGLPPFVKIK